MTNIYIIGAQCTGKTTLVNALKRYFDLQDCKTRPVPNVIHEVARTVLREENFTAHDITSSPVRAFELQKSILRAQNAAESGMGREGWYISDRSGLDPIVYARIYCGEDHASTLMESSDWHESKKRLADAVVIVCEAGGEWLVDDGVRLVPRRMEEWIQTDDMFRQTLHDAGITFGVVRRDMKDIDARVRYVLDKWFERGWPLTT